MRSHTPETLERRIVRCSVDWSSVGIRLIDYLAGRFTYRDAAAWSDVIRGGEILLNGQTVSPERILEMHDRIEYLPKELPEPEADLNYRVAFEDDTLLVVDKPGNLCIHPSGPFFKHTLWHLLCSKYGEIHFINRLDRETSGLLIAAKDKNTAAKLQKNGDRIEKCYLAVVHGAFDTELDATGFLVADETSAVHKKRRFVTTLPEHAVNAESCRTLLSPAGRIADGLSLVRAKLFTGRMHQIRATLCSLGFPVAGDKLYGVDETLFLKIRSDSFTAEDRAKLVFPRQALHSASLSFLHPVTGETIRCESPLPPDIGGNSVEGEA